VEPPQTKIANGKIEAALYLPDAQHGYYRGTRFDWSGVIHSLKHNGHDYYGPWFNKTDPKVIDFIFSGDDIVAGPCSAITGPVEEFTTNGKALGFDEAKAGGTFLKIGIGVLRRPDQQDYNPYRLYEIVDSGKWHVEPGSDGVTFSQEVKDPASGYGYRYTKTVHLVNGKPEMRIEHKLENIGQHKIESSVYDHNFLVLDGQPVGPAYTLKFGFDLKVEHAPEAKLAEVKGREFHYLQELKGRDTVAGEFTGFSHHAKDYEIVIDNKKAGAGMKITADRPLSRQNLWSIRSVLAAEPFIDMSIEPGKSFSWRYNYEYYSLK